MPIAVTIPIIHNSTKPIIILTVKQKNINLSVINIIAKVIRQMRKYILWHKNLTKGRFIQTDLPVKFISWFRCATTSTRSSTSSAASSQGGGRGAGRGDGASYYTSRWRRRIWMDIKIKTNHIVVAVTFMNRLNGDNRATESLVIKLTNFMFN